MAGRAELADREVEEIPHALRSVAQSSARRLPPPLAKSLLDFIAENDGFRAAVGRRVADADTDTSIAVASFLDDPAHSDTMLEIISRAHRVSALESDLAAAERKITKLTENVDRSRQRIESLQHEAELTQSKTAAAARRARAGTKQRLAAAEAALADARAENDLLGDQMENLRQSLDYFRTRLRKRDEREARRAAADPVPRDVTADGYSTDPLEIARRLDRTARLVKFYRSPDIDDGHDERPAEVATFTLPGGIAPDSPDAVEAVVAAVPDRILVDGYNLAGAIDPESIGSKAGRDHAISSAERLKRRTERSRIIVVFDASGADGRREFTTEGGVEVEFEKESIADDRIVDEVMRADDRCVVVTSDRELQLRSERADCVSVFSEALVEWLNR